MKKTFSFIILIILGLLVFVIIAYSIDHRSIDKIKSSTIYQKYLSDYFQDDTQKSYSEQLENGMGYEYFNYSEHEYIRMYNPQKHFDIDLTTGLTVSQSMPDIWASYQACVFLKTTSRQFRCVDDLNLSWTVVMNKNYVNLTGSQIIGMGAASVNFTLEYILPYNSTEIEMKFTLINKKSNNFNNEVGFGLVAKEIDILKDNNIDVVIVGNMTIELNGTHDDKYYNYSNYSLVGYAGNQLGYITLRWNESLSSEIQINNYTGEINSRVSSIIKYPNLLANEEKSISFYWSDPYNTSTTEIIETGIGSGINGVGESFSKGVFYDYKINKWVSVYVDGSISINARVRNSSGVWNPVVIILSVGASDEDVNFAYQQNATHSYIHTVYAPGTTNNLYYYRCLVNDTSPYVFCESQRLLDINSFYDFDTSDDIHDPSIILDNNSCVFITAGIRNTTNTLDEYVGLFKENPSICGQGTFNTTNIATGYPKFVQNDRGYETQGDNSIMYYGGNDFLIIYQNATTAGNIGLSIRYYNSSSDSFGTEYIVNTDVQYVYGISSSGDAIIFNSTRAVITYGLDALQPIYYWGINGINSNVTDTFNPSITMEDAATGIIAMALDTRKNRLFSFSIDDGSGDDLRIMWSNDAGISWIGNETKPSIGTGIYVSFFTANFENSTCNIFLNYDDVGVSRRGYLFNTGGCSAYNFTFYPPTPANGTVSTNTSFIINASVNVSGLRDLNYSLNGINYNLYSNNLVLLMNFNNVSSIGEAYGTTNGTKIYDVSSYNSNFTITLSTNGSMVYGNGKYGGAFSFDGYSQEISTASSKFIPGIAQGRPYSISVWVYPKKNVGGYILDDQNNAEHILVFGGGGYVTFRFYNVSNSVNSISLNSSLNSVPLNTWTHIVAINNGSNLAIYINGVMNSSGNTPGYIHRIWDDVVIGSRGDTTSSFNGSIDELMIFNTTLNSSDVSFIYNSNVNKYGSNGWNVYINQSVVFPSSNNYSLCQNNIYEYTSCTVTYNYVSGNPLCPDMPITFVPPTLANATSSANTSFIVNATVNSSLMSILTYTLNNVNYTLYDSSLILMLNFDNVSAIGENDTHIKDVSTYGNNITCTSPSLCPIVNSGKYNNGYLFDGINDSITVVQNDKVNFSLYDNLTFSMWLYPIGYNSTDSGNAGVFNGASPTKLGFDIFSSGTQMVIWGDITYSNKAYSIPLNNWTHVVLIASWNGTNTTLSAYNNGVLVISPFVSGIGKMDSRGQCLLGREGTTRWFNGTMDNIMVWNRTLNSSDVTLLYNSNLNKYANDMWNVNINQTNLTSGNNNYQLCQTNINNCSSCSALQTYTYNVNTCTYSGSGNWTINCVDSCSLNTNTTVSGTVYLNGVGDWVLNAMVSASDFIKSIYCNITLTDSTAVIERRT